MTKIFNTLNSLENKINNMTTNVSGTITFVSSFTDDFTVVTSSLTKINNINQLSVTATRKNSNTLLNTTYQVGTISFRPSSNISSPFNYLNPAPSSGIGALAVSSDGDVEITTGNNTVIANGTTFTFSIMYI